MDYFVAGSVIYGVLSLILYIYFCKTRNKEMTLFNKMVRPDMAMLLLFMLMVFSMYLGYVKLVYLKDNDFSKYNALLKSVALVFSFLLGAMVLKESITGKNWIGLALIIAGIFLVNVED